VILVINQLLFWLERTTLIGLLLEPPNSSLTVSVAVLPLTTAGATDIEDGVFCAHKTGSAKPGTFSLVIKFALRAP
jgi:hypothetical protein